MNTSQTLKRLFVVLATATVAVAAKADYTNNLLAKWTFSSGTASDLTSDVGAYTFTKVGSDSLTYNAGSISLGDNTELVAAGINTTAVPSLATNATVWVKMKFDTVPTLIPTFLFGLENATAPADWGQATMVGTFDNWGSGNMLGQHANTTAGEYGGVFVTLPATNTYFTMALVMTSGIDQNGYPDPTVTRFQTYYNGVVVGSGSASGTTASCLSFALGLLKSSGGAAYTFDEARVYNKALTASQILLVGKQSVQGTNGLLAEWTFSSGTANDLVANIGDYAFSTASVGGSGSVTYNTGSISLAANTELVAAGINTTDVPSLATNATVWVKMQFDTMPTANPTFYFGLENALAPADYAQATMVGMFADWGAGDQLGQYARTTAPASNEYAGVFVTPPATGTYFTMALVMTSGMDANGPHPGETLFQTYYNGVVVGSGATTGSNVICQSFALGLLKASGGAAYSFDEARVYNRALTATEIAQLENVALPTAVFTSVTRSGAGLIMSGSNGAPNGTYQLLSSTNVALPKTSWTSISTNKFDAGGAFVVTNAIQPTGHFFLIRQ